MRDRGFSIVIGVMLALTLAGCGLEVQNLGIPAQGDNQTEGGLPATGEPEVERPAFHFRSGTLELGDFVYEDIKDNLFDPCQEISAEEFAQIGFESTGQSRYLIHNGGWGCALEGGDPNLIYLVATASSTKDEIVAGAERVSVDMSDVVDDAVTYRGFDDEEESCIAAVDTVRGQFSVLAGRFEGSVTFEELCNEAVTVLDHLYEI
ncbi:DUF3558 domain-containing protein [Corynebacterium sp. CCUG 65737]|uniref:DUF3558 family protein n=1 Tax=Corynebacterium sp. CCUG 65737 TaxID=2823889 RepID=UPI00210A2004|nr:DUF3558 family protein [Corynebacterium sp. CCUG 65737]MCQ4627085.1 DUF3558 domain-containing protein [Corynebacterium sp. CCUG 65737]